MPNKLVAGNWKMFQTPSQAEVLAQQIKREILQKVKLSVIKDNHLYGVLVCPPYVCLERVRNIIKDTGIYLGAQDLHWESQGAYTGKISGDMLKDLGVSHVLIGHSEQRTYFHETDGNVNKKIKSALEHDLIPIVCVGETLEQRDSGKVKQTISSQVTRAFDKIPLDKAVKSIIAYEPCWAIGTGRSASVGQAQEVHQIIRELFSDLYGKDASIELSILYGGSVKPENAAALFGCKDIDGGLIGGASLKASQFVKIVEANLD